MSIAQAIIDAAAIIGISTPASPISSPEESAKKLVAVTHEAGDDIARRADWSRLVKAHGVSALPSSLPADFLRLVPGGAVNVASTVAPVRGPLSSDQVRAIARLGTTSALYFAFEGGQIIGSRALGVGEALSLGYISRNWLVSSDGANFRERATQDDDETLFPERLLTKAIIWRFRRETGLQYQDQMAEWEADLALEIRQDRGVTV